MNLADEAQDAEVRIETERLRNSLLSSVSHDLRTPLATITGAISTILDGGARLDARTRHELLESVREEAERLNRLVQNLFGPGLPAGEEEKVFEKFYQGDSAGGRGAGLSLAICRGVVMAHGGRISAQNLPEGGVAFLFTLPLSGLPPAPLPADA